MPNNESKENQDVKLVDEKVAIHRIYQMISTLNISSISTLMEYGERSLKELGVSNVLDLESIIEKHIEVVKLYLDEN